MRYNRLFFLFIYILIVSACSPKPTQVPIPSVTATIQASQTPQPSPTFTSSPTETPTPQPTLIGGGGSLLFSAYKSMFGGSYSNSSGEFNVYAANPDSTNLTILTQGPDGTSNLLAGASPDGQLTLYYSTTFRSDRLYLDNNRVDLWVTSLQKSEPLQLNRSQIHTYLGGAAWGKDGTIFFIGWDSEGLGLFHIQPDGSALERVAKPVSLAATGKAEILFSDPQNKGIYWVTGGYCTTNGFCGARYYWTALDGSDQKQVWKWVNGATNEVSLSPDGKWIAYDQFVGNQIQDRPNNGCYVSSVDGSQIQLMTGYFPRCAIRLHQTDFWSPDSQYIIYSTADREQMKYPNHLYSPANNSVADLPDLQTPACEVVHWLPDGERVFFTECRSNFEGYSMPAPMRLLDLVSKKVTIYPDSGFCELAFSPDSREVFLYNCHRDVSADMTFKFFTLELETGTLSPLFPDVMNGIQKDAWRILYAPVPWNGWAH